MPRYHLSSRDPASHRLQVEAHFPRGGDLAFPSWAPGSYLLREFGRQARDVSARTPDGAPVVVERLSRNEWRVRCDRPVIVSYEVYCHEKSVRTPYVGDDLWFFLPSNVLVYDPSTPVGELEIVLDVPPGFTAVCPLGDQHAFSGGASGSRATWRAATVDALMDAPIAAAAFEHTEFAVDGVAHHHWVEPGHNGDLARMNTDLQRIVEAARDTVRAPERGLSPLPYRSYHFVTLHMARGHGGLEHNDCSVLLRPRLGFADPKGYEEFLTLAAHEHFHAWNVKRIRPDRLGPPFDYTREHYIADLWWLEGGTVYYEERIAYRAGLVSRDRHLERLGELVRDLRAQPGRFHQSLEDSSWDAWIKLYRPGEDSKNSTISYYLKGAVVVWAMDLELLARSEGRVGVDDLLRELWARWGSKDVGYPHRAALFDIARSLAGEPSGGWEQWWALHVLGTAEVAIEAACAKAGLTLRWSGGGGGWLGVETGSGERIVISSVRESGPAAGALSPGDELLAIDGERVLGSDLADRLRGTKPGQRVSLLVSRDGRVLAREVTVGAAPPTELKVEVNSAIQERERRVLDAWLLVPPRSTD